MPSKPTTKRSYRSTARTAPGVADALRKFGKRVRELRAAAGLTQEQTAAAAKVDMKHYQEIEAGRVNATIATLVGLARAFKVDVAALFSVGQ